MSEYQYYEFCKMNTPLTAEARKEMYSLSSRAKVSTHGASYVYNYGDFRGDPKALLLKYFDVFFYISNFGCLQLMFKYSDQEVNLHNLKKMCVENVIVCEARNKNIILDINFSHDEGLGWIEGEGMLPDLLPLYEEIRLGNYQFLHLMAELSNGLSKKTNSNPTLALSQAQEAFFKYAGIDQKVFYE